MRDIMFLAHRVPYPPDRGDKIRAFHALKHLAQHARVHLVAFADDDRDIAAADGLAPWTASRSVIRRTKSQPRAAIEALASGRPVSIVAFDDFAVQRAVDAVLAREDVAAIYVYSSQMAQYLPADRGIRTVMDFVDVDSAKFAAYADTARWPMTWLYQREGRVLLAYDAAVAARADIGLFVSAEEAAVFRRATDAPRIQVVENGIDTALFDPVAHFAPVDAGQGPLIVFTGQMDYRPNVEGATWFARDVLPLVQARHPDARFAIVGRAPTADVTALGQLPGVIVTGEVSDIRGWLAAASVVVAPLKLARGIQNKVLEAMAMARPVVASVPAAEGIDHAATIRVAADTATMARAVGDLIATPAEAATLGQAARRRVQDRYSWAASLAPLDAILGFDMPAKRDAA